MKNKPNFVPTKLLQGDKTLPTKAHITCYHIPILPLPVLYSSLSLSLSLSLSSMMTSSFKSCWISLSRKIKLFLLQRLRTSDKRSSRRKHNSFDLLINTSFAAMGLSNQFRQVFKVIDSNGDGKISPLELSEVLLCLGYDKSKATKDAQGMVTQMDCNGDGFIDLDEFMDAVHVDSTTDSKEYYDHLMDAFLIFDSDKNGLISAKELQRVLISLGCSNCSLQECKRMIRGVDKDGDGFVDFQEFRSMMMTQNSIHQYSV